MSPLLSLPLSLASQIFPHQFLIYTHAHDHIHTRMYPCAQAPSLQHPLTSLTSTRPSRQACLVRHPGGPGGSRPRQACNPDELMKQQIQQQQQQRRRRRRRCWVAIGSTAKTTLTHDDGSCVQGERERGCETLCVYVCRVCMCTCVCV